ncbi:MAG: molybdopterin molybdotransferase MoeA [Tunicatimonas sp.]
MITTQQATAIIHDCLLPLASERVPLTEATGRVLRMPVLADRDFPPFHRVTMDGVAFVHNSVPESQTLPVAGTHFAGGLPPTCGPGECWEVMTGAVLPLGADTVVRYEDVDFTETDGKKIAVLRIFPAHAGQSIHQRGADRRRGDTLLETGTLLRAPDVAIAASVGKTQLSVSQLPRVGVVSTGDELVALDQVPLPHQIRQSNAYALQAALAELGVPATRYHLPDERSAVDAGIAEALQQNDLILISGGVSRGKRDYVPEALAAAGVTERFHRVQQRPGKPLWFGQRLPDKVVFGLPGNPVSTLVGFYRYVKPWLLASLHQTMPSPRRAALGEPVAFAPELTYFLGVRIQAADNGRLTATPQPGNGSGDFVNLARCQGFLELPAERSQFAAGEVFPLHLLRGW